MSNQSNVVLIGLPPPLNIQTWTVLEKFLQDQCPTKNRPPKESLSFFNHTKWLQEQVARGKRQLFSFQFSSEL